MGGQRFTEVIANIVRELLTLKKHTEKKLINFENKALKQVFGLTREDGIRRIKHNKE